MSDVAEATAEQIKRMQEKEQQECEEDEWWDSTYDYTISMRNEA